MRAIGFSQDKAESLADELFNETFDSCNDKSDEDLRDNFKSLSHMDAADGGIKFTPKQKDAIFAFTHWVKDLNRLGKDPEIWPFPLHKITTIKSLARSHKAYIDRYETVSSAAKPQQFTKDTAWEDWAPSFLNYLRCIPGRNGVPLLYITREAEIAVGPPEADYLENYIANAPLSGDAFMSDRDQVHVYLVNFTAQNDEAESILKINERERNGRKDWMALKLHYEGRGIYATDITKAEKILDTLFYQGEKKPHMWWLEFERRLNMAFATYVKYEGRQVHSDQHKLRILLNKVKCEWLNPLKASIGIELSRTQNTFTYAQALVAFKTEIHKKFPPGSNPMKIKRTMQELEGHRGDSYRGGYGGRGRGRGRGRGGGRGQGRGRGGRGRGNQQRTDAKTITLKNGRKIEYHASYNFPTDIYSQFTDDQIDTLKRERREYKERNGGGGEGSSKRSIQALMAEIEDLKSIVSQGSNNYPSSIRGDRSTAISQITTGTSVMGGRNEQHLKRLKRRGGNGDESE